MIARFFVDTNVLVYSRDTGQPAKQARSSEWLGALSQQAVPKASFQVMIELYSVLTRKLARPMEASEARELVASLAMWDPIQPTVGLLRAAWEIEARYRISWWDAQIVAAAQLQRCDYLLTEDLQHGQRFGALTVLSPFLSQPGEVLAN
jgi:predicted nucleic acid-binding protein